jgi:hypothetical protein
MIKNKEKVELIQGQPVEKQFKFGNVQVLFHDKDNEPLITIGPQWNYFLLMFIIIFVLGVLSLYQNLNSPQTNYTLAIISTLFWLFNLTMYLFTAFASFGIPKELL